MSIGTFTLIRNEASWIAAHILRVLPFIDEMVFFDGNSTDGTLEIIEAISNDEDRETGKITLVKDKDPKNLQGDYVRLFNECMRTLNTDFAYFLHPDMFLVNPERLLEVKDCGAVAMSTKMRSFGGEPDGQLFEMLGRGEAWKNIYRLKNPDLGAHYWGDYGHSDEDVYFSSITGDKHEHYGTDFKYYPYMVQDSGVETLHFSDVRPYERRFDRMVKCLLNNGYDRNDAIKKAHSNPRVTLKDSPEMRFVPCNYPDFFIKARNKYRHLERPLVSA